MNIQIKKYSNKDKPTTSLLLISTNGLKKLLKSKNLPKDLSVFLTTNQLKKLTKKYDFKANNKQKLQYECFIKNEPHKLIFIGIEVKKNQKANHYRDIGCLIYKLLKANSVSSCKIDTSLVPEISADKLYECIEGIRLSNYDFEKLKTKKPKTTNIKILIKTNQELETRFLQSIATITSSTKFARDLVNLPANKCTPTDVVRLSKNRMQKKNLRVRVYDHKQLKKMSANLLLSVAQGSIQNPYLLRINYKPQKLKDSTKKIALVGKGVTFDSGGLSIKSGAGMMTMKCDMAGAAAVVGAMDALAGLKPKVEVTAYIPLVENMINGKATKPGDVIKGLHGKTVEILNTDAEGRLILADALALADKEGASQIVSVATLTGACVVALGTQYAGLFGNNKSQLKAIQTAANDTGELLWELPLADEYRDHLKSQVADIKNIGSGRYGGAITAALFLEHSIKSASWCHLDIAGPAFLDAASSYNPKGGTGYGVRTLIQYVMSL